jgi:hypothetical protein
MDVKITKLPMFKKQNKKKVIILLHHNQNPSSFSFRLHTTTNEVAHQIQVRFKGMVLSILHPWFHRYQPPSFQLPTPAIHFRLP